jgi:hypothetical protein
MAMRFFYSKVELVERLSENEIERLEATNQPTSIPAGTVKVKIDFESIHYFYPDDEGVYLFFKNGTSLYIMDSFERIDRLHNEYLHEKTLFKKLADEN